MARRGGVTTATIGVTFAGDGPVTSRMELEIRGPHFPVEPAITARLIDPATGEELGRATGSVEFTLLAPLPACVDAPSCTRSYRVEFEATRGIDAEVSWSAGLFYYPSAQPDPSDTDVKPLRATLAVTVP